MVMKIQSFFFEVDEKEHPVAVQIFGSDAEIMSQMAKNWKRPI